MPPRIPSEAGKAGEGVSRRSFLSKTAFYGAVSVGSAAAGWKLFGGRGGAVTPAPPDILMFTIDTLRADRLGCYGYRPSTGIASISPTMDALASRGVLFERVISQASYTTVSMASMFTGLLPCNNGVMDMNHAIEPPTLSERLRDAGYATFGISANPYLGEDFGFTKGFDEYYLRGPLTRAGARRDINTYPKAENLVVPAREFIARAKDAGRPFFAYVHSMDVHEPYVPAPAYAKAVAPGSADRAAVKEAFELILAGEKAQADRLGLLEGDYLDRVIVPRAEERAFFDVQLADLTRFQEHVLAGEAEAASALLAEISSWYDGAVYYTDRVIGSLLADLSRAGLDRNLVVIIASDHGEEFLEHGGCGHGQTLFQEVISVPLVMSGAGLPQGMRVRARVRNVDIFDTLLDVAGAEAGGGDGRTLMNLVRGEPSLNRPAAAYLGVTKGHDRSTRCLIDADDLKLILANNNGVSETLAFDLAADASETRNLAAADFPVAALAARLDALERGTGAGRTYEIEGQTKRQLEALGYLN